MLEAYTLEVAESTKLEKDVGASNEECIKLIKQTRTAKKARLFIYNRSHHAS